ncbi:MAG: CoxG family protein [Paracoccaceae bacterium]
MEMSGSVHIAADRQAVWDALLNPDVLMQCVPGCQEMAGTPDDGVTATVVQKVGPVKATFKGAVTLEDRVAPDSLRLVGEGKGGAAGFAKGGAQVQLQDVEGGTELSYTVEAKVGGKLAQLGSRIIDGFARKMADKFFEDFRAAVGSTDAPDDPQGDEDQPKKGWLKSIVSR